MGGRVSSLGALTQPRKDKNKEKEEEKGKIKRTS